jgi:hypothetical protein
MSSDAGSAAWERLDVTAATIRFLRRVLYLSDWITRTGRGFGGEPSALGKTAMTTSPRR